MVSAFPSCWLKIAFVYLFVSSLTLTIFHGYEYFLCSKRFVSISYVLGPGPPFWET